jgi:hypothetical protein
MSNKEIIKQLKTLKGIKDAGTPNKKWVASNRDILMSQINPSMQSNTDKYLLGENIYFVK